MTRLTFTIEDFYGNILKSDIPTFAEALSLKEKLGGIIKEQYTPIIEKYVRRQGLPISKEWLARHPEAE